MRSKTGVLMSAAAIAALAGSAMGSVMVTPSDVITWGGGSSAGRSLAAVQPAGLTWNWIGGTSGTGQPSQVQISTDGRVYFQGQYAQTPVFASFSTNNHRAVFTATNSTDLAVYDGIYDGGTKDGVTIQNSATLSGVSTTTPRIAGNRVAYGLGVSGPGIITSGVGQNNSKFYIGDAMGSSQAAQRSDSVTLNDTAGNPTAVLTSVDLRGISQQNSEINSSGTAVMWLAVPTAAGTGTPLAGQFVTTANAAAGAPRGNTAFLATKSVSDGYTVIAQGGQAAPGVAGGFFQNGGNGVNGFFSKINRNGQVGYSGRLVTQFPVTTGSDDVAHVYTPGSGSVLVYREGRIAPDATGADDAGGALFSNAIQTGRSFSNHGLFYGADLTGGDVNSTAPATGQPDTRNNSGAYIWNASTGTTTRVFRRNDPIPGLPAGFNFGGMGASNFNMNNSGVVSFGTFMQGTSVITAVNFSWNQFGDGLITAPGVQGNAEAIVTGPANNLQVVARSGMLAPGGGGLYLKVVTNNGSLAMNNNGDVIFDCDTTPYAPGASIGIVGQTPSQSVLPAGPRILYSWTQAFGLVPLFHEQQSVEVDPGVFKTVSSYNLMATDNGDGGASGLNDNGTYAVKLTFTDGSWAVVKGQVPAPGAGVMALLGLGVAARRRRK